MAGLFSSKKSKKEKEEKAAAAKNAAAIAAVSSATSNHAPSVTTTTSGGNGSIASSTTMAPPPNSVGKQQQQQTNNNAINPNNNSTVLTSTTLSMTPASSSTSSVPVHLRENSSASLDYSPQQHQQQKLNNKSSVDSDKRMYHIQQQQHQYQLQQHSTLQQPQTNSNGGSTGSNLVSASSISTHDSFAHLSSSNGPWISAQVMSPSPFPRFSHTASYVQTGTDIYVFGGVVKGSAQRDMHVIDSQSLHSQLLPVGGGDSPPSTSGHTAVTLGHYIMYFGGKDAKNKCSDALYVLHTIRKEWNKPTILGLLPAPRHSHAACVIGTTLYVFGGQFNGYYLNDVACFDMKSLNTSNPRWNRLEPASELPPARAGHCAAAHDGKVYIFGGADDQFFYNDIWCYDPQTNKWEAVPAFGVLPTSRQGHAASVVDDTMYIYGGMNHEDQLLGDLSAFKFNDRRWLTFPDTVDSAPPRTEHAMCSVGDRIYILGGQLELNTEEDGSIYILDTTKIRYHEPSLGPRSGYDNDSGLRVDAALDDSNSSFPRPTPSPDSIRHSNDVNNNNQDSRRAPQQQQQQTIINSDEQYIQQQNGNASARFADDSNVVSSPPQSQTRVSLDAADGQVFRRRTVGKTGSYTIHEVEPRGTQSIDETRRPSMTDQDYYERDSPRSQNQRPLQPLQYNSAQYANLQQSQSQQQSQDVGRRRSLTDNKNRGSLNPPPRASLEQSRASSQPSQDSTSPLSSQEIQYNSKDAEIRDLKQREQWLLAEVAMTRKKTGERPLSMTLALKDSLGLFEADRDSEKYKIMQALLSCKAELERSKSSIVAQAQVASNKLREAERIRTAALQEAAYLKAKVSALQSGEVSALVSTETARAVDLEKRLTTALGQVDRLQSQQAQHEALLERERHGRETAQERARQASAAAEEAQQARTRSLTDMTSLHERASVAEGSLREVEAKHASSEARLSSYQQQSTALFSQISGLKTTVDHQKKSLEKAKLAYSVANDRAEHADRLWTQARQEIDHTQMEFASARADFERAQREADHWKTKAQETDLLWQKAKSENEAMRTLLEEDMNASYSPGANARKHDSIMAITSASRVAELEHELGTLRHLLKESQAAAAQANKDLGESMLRISQLESTSMSARTEAGEAQRQLSTAEDRVASLEAQVNQKEEALEEMAKEQENNEVQLGVLRGVMRENGLLADDLILDALSQGLTGQSSANGAVTMTGLKTKVQEAERIAQESRQQLEEMSVLKMHQEERIQQLQADYQTAVHYVQGSETMVKRLRDEAQAAKAEKEVIQKALQEMEAAHGQAREVQASAGQAAVAATTQLEEEVTELHRQLHDSMGRSMELEQKMEEMTRALQNSESQVEVTQAELKTLKSKHHEHKKQGAISTETFKAKVEELENALEETQASLAETRHQLELTQYELEQSHALNTSTGRELEDALTAVKSHQEALAAQQAVAAAAQGHSETKSEEALDSDRKRAQALAAHQEELELVIENAHKTIQELQSTNIDLEQQLKASENKIAILLDNFQGPESVRNSMASLNGNDDLIQRLMEANHHTGVGSGRSYLTPMSHGSHSTDRSSADSLANELELLRSNWGQAQVNGSPYRPPAIATGGSPPAPAPAPAPVVAEDDHDAVEIVHAVSVVPATATATTTTAAAAAASLLSPTSAPSSPIALKSPVVDNKSSSNSPTVANFPTAPTATASSPTAAAPASSSSTSAQKLEEYERMIEDMAHQRRQYEE
ncbi:Negative regulator of mitotic exit [Linnemannia hyalina]|uniref:Negative regulator of mitotic exit n=1 Tax=Linnemannia hyalina TaxID=64524 RepID=A0A9P7Y579_9FUNG|nr:Negative regulator of mitotic exit [Linnemannia hyalina]